MAKADSHVELDQQPGCLHPRETPVLFGQKDAEDRFLQAWANERLHQAWLLRGPPGIGKATLAYRIARAMIAHGPGPVSNSLFRDVPSVPRSLEGPDNCRVAQRIRAGAEPCLSVLRLTVNPKTGRPRTQIVVEDVRAAKGFLHLSATDGGWRVVIVDPVDAMNQSAANALLKMLEEPPDRVIFLLISQSPGGLLPTIRSRCRFLDLAPLGKKDLRAALEQQATTIAANEETQLSELASGSVGQAMQLLEGHGLALYGDIIGVLADARVDRKRLLQLAARCSGKSGVDAYRLTTDLLLTLLGRLARSAATGVTPSPASQAEPGLMGLAARSPADARLWADVTPVVAGRLRHALAVNLDPSQTIIDTFLELDQTLSKIRHAA
ncbi:MAG: DNA polymerase III subunit delta' [Pseudomonadota bacterium]